MHKKGPLSGADLQNGAPEWSRTITPLLAQEPESCVSTNFTTGAMKGEFIRIEMMRVNARN